jgi:hypothetical protein
MLKSYSAPISYAYQLVFDFELFAHQQIFYIIINSSSFLIYSLISNTTPFFPVCTDDNGREGWRVLMSVNSELVNGD